MLRDASIYRAKSVKTADVPLGYRTSRSVDVGHVERGGSESYASHDDPDKGGDVDGKSLATAVHSRAIRVPDQIRKWQCVRTPGLGDKEYRNVDL